MRLLSLTEQYKWFENKLKVMQQHSRINSAITFSAEVFPLPLAGAFFEGKNTKIPYYQ